jgi:catechol 2,3-dioxygenase-like lactoylglutathione lyase family enzyme
MTIKQSNVTINVSDMNRSLSFYESLGLTTQSRWGNQYAQLSAPGIVIGLHPTDATHLKSNSGNVSIGFSADNLEEAGSLLQQLSIKATPREEEGGSFLHFEDPDGTALYFIKSRW